MLTFLFGTNSVIVLSPDCIIIIMLFGYINFVQKAITTPV